ncbi:MAG: M90 family metallopeptidase [Brumimicrobium sp.]
MKNKSYLYWIVLFLILLGAIPILLYNKGVETAKIIGFVVVIAVLIALWYWSYNVRKKSNRNQRIKLNTNDKFWLEKNIPFYKRLSKKDKKIFIDRVGIFLADIQVTEVDKEVPEKETCLYVASSAVIAYWGLPYWNYGDLSEVLVYPSNFNMDNSLDKLGVVSGKVYHGGLMNNTMILSLPALQQGFKIDNDKKNVGVHEFSHLLDKSDGSIDGIPPLMGDEDRKIWIQLMDKEIQKINNDNSTIPEYAGTDKKEFFAVVTEYYKECPKLLKVKHKELYEVLDQYYNQTEKKKG